ncbi:alpha-N-acetylneuraminide alpha-2,8-sialyltransferase-like [Ptychodera flava]|uniref:alpha-N-acetylneuraminide alpha-2,8-sialyltransferase-like n=1 Tax=Ptychodera flava TaxID=63121 RepID=UPI00396A96B5
MRGYFKDQGCRTIRCLVWNRKTCVVALAFISMISFTSLLSLDKSTCTCDQQFKVTSHTSSASEGNSPATRKSNVKAVEKSLETEAVANRTLIMEVIKSIRTNWTFNATAAGEFRSQIEKSCNTTASFLTTKKSVELNKVMRYSAEKGTINVTLDVYKRFPRESPLNNAFHKRCSVVGSSGILLGSQCGKEIDSADFVVRFNQAIVRNYSKDAGIKTHLATCNPSIVRDRYSSLTERESAEKFKAFMTSEYGNSIVYFPAFTHKFCTKLSFRGQDALKLTNMTVVFGHPSHISSSHGFWKRRGVNARHLSSGILLLSGFVNFCEELHLYGFWPFYEDLEGNSIQYHYFDDALMQSAAKMKQKYHNMPSEFQLLIDLHNQGILQLHLGSCVK